MNLFVFGFWGCRHFLSFVFDVNMCLVFIFYVVFHLWVNAAIHWQYDCIGSFQTSFLGSFYWLPGKYLWSLCQFWDFYFFLMWWMIQLLNNYYHSWEKHACFYFLFCVLFTDKVLHIIWHGGQIWGKTYHLSVQKLWKLRCILVRLLTFMKNRSVQFCCFCKSNI